MLNSTYRTKRRMKAFRTATKKPQHLAVENLEQRLVLDSTVVFNEIMYNPPGEPDDGLEWIELHNQLNANMDISEWVLDGGVGYTFPDGTVVLGRGYTVIASDPQAFQAATGIAALGPFTGRLDNRGEELRLYNNDDRLMNVVEFEDGGEWPTAPDGSGATLSKANELSASHVPSNWTPSPEIGGTPGAANFVEPGTFIFEDVLPEGAVARALVPFDLDGSLGTRWIDPAYDDSAWTVGTTAVGFDNGRNDSYTELLGLDLDAPPNGQAPVPMQNANAGVYIRIPFELNTDLTEVDKLILRMRFDDGFVAHLNGTEIASANAPSPLSWLSSATRSNSDRNAVRTQDFNIGDVRDLFVQGENILAIHALNRNAGDDDLLMFPQIVLANEVFPDAGISLAINEIAAADAESFFVEVANDGSEPLEIGGFVLAGTGDGGGEYVFPAQRVPAGGFVAVSQQELGFRPADGERLFLYSAGRDEVVDGRPVLGRLRGRSDRYEDRWLYPDTATLGAANSFQFTDDIVINEIMYHAAPEQLVEPAKPATFERTMVLAMDASDWRYRETAAPLPADWVNTTHVADGAEWKTGQGPIGFSVQDFADQINTQLNFPALNVPPFITYYFEHDFEFTGSENPYEFELKHFVHGGAVIYVNGVEVERYNMPEGEVSPDTPSSRELRRRQVVVSETIGIPPELIGEGTNRLSVEVHRPGLRAIDVMFGAQLVLREEVAPGVPATEFIESDEEWIELFNQGTSEVDLTGWELRDAAQYEFEPGTTLGPGEYLVVANDADALSEKYSGINIVGDFGGTLSNHDERILLVDANNNPADEVHYYESGKWPEFADGGSSSLELRNPSADNNNAAAWAASDETGKSQWQTYTFREVSLFDTTNDRTPDFHEFVFGLLESGEILIDDIEVIEAPDLSAVSVLQNGDFEADTLGESPAAWRLIGNHIGTVVADPDDPQNQVLHLVATGPQQHVHDHAETTFRNDELGEPIEVKQDGTQYEFTFRAKWLSGSSQLSTRLYFSRAPHKVLLDVPHNNGTPGARNSTYEANVGPTYAGFGHAPNTPTENGQVTVTVAAQDPDGVASMNLWWRADGQPWNQTEMTGGDSGVYAGTIPGAASETVVQFYVEGHDTLGVVSTFPADGADSRALYVVEDSAEARKPNDIIDTFRIVMLVEDQDRLFERVDRMSNHFFSTTLIHNNTSFYDVDVRQIGSRWIRPNSGYKIRLHPDNPFYGVHDSIRFDINGLAEVVMKQMINRAGGTKASMYDDIAFLVAPPHRSSRSHTGVALLQLTRFENVFLDEQFVDGSSGTKWELDDVTYPNVPVPRGDAEGLKSDTLVNTSADFGVNNSEQFASQHDNREFYRSHILIKSQRTRDDFEAIVDFTKAIHLEPEEGLYEATQEIMDVDLWMRHYADQAYFGNWDSYGFRRPKNLRLYLRPEDNKMIPFFWDCDLCNFTEPIYNQREAVSRLDEIRDIPANLRLYWGHMLDFINRSFNEEYVATWAAHYGELTGGNARGGDENFNGIVASTRNRTAQALREMETGRGGISKVDFAITSDAANVTIENGMVTLAGTGWVDIRNIRLRMQDGNQVQWTDLETTWTDEDKWEIQLPVGLGENQFTLESFDYQDNSIGTQSITVTSTESNPVKDAVRISEINYNPYAPTTAELAVDADLDNNDFEFIEISNVGTDTVNLLNSRFTNGIQFQFPLTLLSPGESGVIVKDVSAFQLRYGTDVNILGEFEGGRLNNTGEGLTLVDPLDQTILDVEYGDSDPWPESADGVGATLQLVDAANTDADRFGKYYSWQGSMELGGSPGAESAAAIGVVINEVLTITDQSETQTDAIELYNTTGQPIDIGGWYLSDSSNNLLKFQIPAGTTIAPLGYAVFDETNFNPNPQSPAANHFALSGSSGDDVWLVVANEEGRVQTIVDEVHFGAARNGQSFGRTPNGSGRLAPMSSLTLSGANASAEVGSVVISEIHYHPETQPDDAPLTVDELEFVEIVNTSSESIELAGWRLRGGVDFDFDSGTLAPGEIAVLISFNPNSSDNGSRLDAFRAHYGIDETVHMFGGYQGRLSNGGEAIRLLSPQSPADAQSSIVHVMEDEVLYDNLSPWPSEAAGSGKSLTRTSLSAWGNDPAIWTAAAPSPGAADVAPQPGDSNGDGVFNQLDIVAVLQGGKYLTGQPATFEQGDWNGDGVFNQLDIVAAQQTGNYRPGGNNAVSSGVKADPERYLEEVDLLFAKLAF